MSIIRTESYLSTSQRLALALGLALALFFRLWRIDEFISVDEHLWRTRSIAFYQGIVDRSFIQTCRTEHPGVITMWAGVGGYRIAERLETANVPSPLLRRLLYPQDYDQGVGLYPETMWSRRIIALITWLGVVGIYSLGKRFLSPNANLLTTLLVAFDPFYLAYSRVHHLDGLLACFVALSLWALLAYCQGGQRRYLLLSGVMGALATLTKAPGIYTGLGMVAILGWQGWRTRATHPGWVKRWLADALLWTMVAVALGFALWPAMWTNPGFSIKRVYDGVVHQVSNPHENGSFFFGAYHDDPGPLFYPVAWLMRTTPFVMTGLVALPWALQRGARTKPALVALLCALGFMVLVTLSLKKADRYLLPIFPILCLPAGIGLAWLGERAAERWPRARQSVLAAGLGIVLLSIAWLLPAAPYYTAYYNPLLGGAAIAPDFMLIGWGEGLEQAARYLNNKPNAEELLVASMSPSEFKPFFKGQTTLAGELPLVEPDYFVTYASHVQRGFVPEVRAAVAGQEPEFVARTPNGLPFAWVYPNRVKETELEVILRLVAADRQGGVLLLNTSPAAVRRSDLPLETIVTERRDFMFTELERINSQYDALWFVTFDGVRDASSAAMRDALGHFAWMQRDFDIGGIRVSRYGLSTSRLYRDYGIAPMYYAVGDHIEFLGYDRRFEPVKPGERLELLLHWRATQPVAESYKVFLHVVAAGEQLIAQDDSAPQGNTRPTNTWTPGQVILDGHAVDIPADTPPGRYAVYIGMYDLETMQRLPLRGDDDTRLPDDRLPLLMLEIKP